MEKVKGNEKQQSTYSEFKPKQTTESFKNNLTEEIESYGGEWKENPLYIGSVGRTMFDMPNSKDNLVSVLLSKEEAQKIPSQRLVTVGHKELNDGRVYRGIVVKGPFYEPDGLRADAPVIVTTTVKGASFLPGYHGRVEVEILGELVDGDILPPRYRPQPSSPVFALGHDETVTALKLSGDINLGLAIGHEEMNVCFPSDKKSVLPRHTAILGTTGGGKSTTVANLVREQQLADVATILIDTEGEYTAINKPTDNQSMISSLKRRNKKPQRVENTKVFHLVGRETSNPDHPNLVPFSLRFDQLPPDSVMEILGLSSAQQDCYLKAYEIARKLMVSFKVYGTTEKEKRELIELDESERAFPKLQLSMMYDIVQTCARVVAKEKDENGDLNVGRIRTLVFEENQSRFLREVENERPKGDKRSWFKVQGRLGELLRLGIFDHPKVNPLNYKDLTSPGQVSIIDLGDTDSPRVNNLAIAELLRGVFIQQNENYQKIKETSGELQRVVVMIEEAHEFLSASRVKQMPALLEQVSRLAKRGRKRWLGLTFITQFPQHLPNDVLGLVNNFVIHKITDVDVIGRLRKTFGAVDDSLWHRVSSLSAGQAIVKMESMSRPLLVAMNPAPCKLLMVD